MASCIMHLRNGGQQAAPDEANEQQTTEGTSTGKRPAGRRRDRFGGLVEIGHCLNPMGPTNMVMAARIVRALG